MRRTGGTSLRQMSEINLTPLMDLTFILLITFIITFPLIEQGISVNLPSAKADPITAEDSRSVTLDAGGQIYLDDLPISIEDLRTSIVEAGRTDPEVSVMVRADEGIAYGKVVSILKILHEAKITRMALVTRENGEA